MTANDKIDIFADTTTGGKLDLTDRNIVVRMTLDFFDKYDMLKDFTIIAMRIGRAPISSKSEKLVRTFVKLDVLKVKEDLELDELYHVFIELALKKDNDIYDRVVFTLRSAPTI